MEKLKVGDKIKKIKGDTYNGMKVGDTGTIKRICDKTVSEPGNLLELTKFGDGFASYNFKLVGTKPTHIITWDETTKDPYEVVYSLKEAKQKAKELLEKEEVIKESIEIYEIKKAIKAIVKTSIIFKGV